jgi:hypothetical protein
MGFIPGLMQTRQYPRAGNQNAIKLSSRALLAIGTTKCQLVIRRVAESAGSGTMMLLSQQELWPLDISRSIQKYCKNK